MTKARARPIGAPPPPAFGKPCARCTRLVWPWNVATHEACGTFQRTRLADVFWRVCGWPPDLAAAGRLLAAADRLLPEGRASTSILTPDQQTELLREALR